jgi:GT2 family glycosyltransferase
MRELRDPAVSVVVPTYNRAVSLGRLLGHLANCELPAGGAEIVVVDDGSSDDTAEVVARSPIDVVFIRQANAGAAAARNKGWRAARGAVIAFVDDDCVPSPTWLVDLVEALDREPGWAAVGGAIEPLVDGMVARFVQAERLVGHGADERGVRYLVTANAAFRRTALEAVGGFDEDFPAAAGEDTDLGFRLAAAGMALGTTASALVLHDHRTSIRGLYRTYHRHGQARSRLARAHPDLGIGSSARTMLGPRYWIGRYAYYRRTAPAPSAAAYVAMRAVGLACYGAGVLRP